MFFARDVAEVLALLHVWPIATVVGNDGHIVGGINADRAWQLEQILGVVNGETFESHRLEQAGHARLFETGGQRVRRTPLHIRTVTTALGKHRKAIEFADGHIALRLRKQGKRHLNSELIRREIFGNARGVVATLHIGAVLAGLHHDRHAVGVVTKWEGVDFGGIDFVEVLDDESLQPGQLHIGVITEIEALQPMIFLLLITRDGIEVFLDPRRERIIDEAGEVLLHQSNHRECGPGWYEGLTLLPHVAAILHRLDDAGPGTGATDTELLEALHDAGFGVARRRRGGMSVRRDRRDRHRLTDDEGRQECLLLLVVGGVFVG